MSKEFEELWDAHKVSKMQQPVALVNGFKSLCEEFFTAGRALGRREMKGECKAVAAGMPVPDFGNDMKYDGYYQATEDIAAAIEAIPEEG